MKPDILFFMYTSLILLAPTVHAQRLVIGTYTGNTLSKGIYVYDFDTVTGEAKFVNYTATQNPSYQAMAPGGRYIYSVNENNEGAISAFRYHRDKGSLELINLQPNNGSAPCYLSVDKTGKWLFAGNYSSGNLSVHALSSEGSVGAVQQTVQHSGSGPDKNRQQSPHVHCTYISPDNRFLYVPDLGIDKVMIYPFNAKAGKLDTLHRSFVTVPPGSGPRHIIFSKDGKKGYLIEELSGAISVIARKGRKHQVIQRINNLPQQYNGASADIHLSPDERFLYSSHRGNSTLQIHRVDIQTGKLSFAGEQTTLGNFPRNFSIHPSGQYLLAANQKSGDVVVFKRDILTGLLTDTGHRIQVPEPVCLQWLE